MSEASILDRLAALSVPSQLGVRPTLDRMRALLANLGNPEDGLPVIHVGGTSGKGSTATLIAAVLREAGLRVALHVKPHLRTVRERITIHGEPIAGDALLALIDEVSPAARRVTPSWHELTTTLALLAFRRAEVDVAVIEVGLGGTWDSTNVVQPGVVVLTNVGLDHVEVLGPTVERIAEDKAGIIKPGSVVISGATQPSVQAIFARRAAAAGVPLLQLGREFNVDTVTAGQDGSTINLSLPDSTMNNVRLAMIGAHQAANGALAAMAASAFLDSVPEPAIRRVLGSVQVPGRLEAIDRRPLVLLDGAHSPPKMTALSSAVRDLFPGRRIVAVVASLGGHDLAATWAAIAPLFDGVVATRVDNPADFGPGRSIPPEDVVAAIGAGGFAGEAAVVEPPAEALAHARRQAGPNDVLLVTGSIYLVGALRPV